MSNPQYRKQYLNKKREAAHKRHLAGHTKARIENSMRNWLSNKLSITKYRCRKRAGSHRRQYWKPHKCNLTIECLLNLWEKQNGRCAITKILLNTKFGSMYSATIDRIDHKLEYAIDNIQLAGLSANLAKGKYPHSMILDWIDQLCTPSRQSELPTIECLRRLADGVVHRCRWGRDGLGDKKITSSDWQPILQDLWESQSGKCALTTIPLTNNKYNPFEASVDRINPKAGYISSNIHLVCTAINHAKNNRSMSETKKWIEAVRSNYK
jgi:hypothetical protein